MEPHTAHLRPIGTLSPLQTFIQTAKPRETQTNPLAHALTGPNEGPYSATNTGEQNAWEKNLMATASLRGKIGELSDGWQKTSSTLQGLVGEVRQLNSKHSQSEEDSKKRGIVEAEDRSKLITELTTVCEDSAEKMTAEHCGITQAMKDENTKLEQGLQLVREQLAACQTAVLSSKKIVEKAMKKVVELIGTIDTRLGKAAELSDGVREFKVTLDRTEELVRETHMRSHHDEEYESRLSALIERNTGTEREDAMMDRVQKCADGLLEAVRTTVEAQIDRKLQEFSKSTSKAMKRLEDSLELILANQAKILVQRPIADRKIIRSTCASGKVEERDSLLLEVDSPFDSTAKAIATASLNGVPETSPTNAQIRSESKGSPAEPAGMVTDVILETTTGQTTETKLRTWNSSGSAPGQRGVEEVRTSSGKKRMLMTFSSDDDEEEDRLLSAKRTRKTARKTPDTNQNSVGDATDLPHDLPVAREVLNSRLQEEPQEFTVRVLLEEVPMQSRRRLSISPEADETLQ